MLTFTNILILLKFFNIIIIALLVMDYHKFLNDNLITVGHKYYQNRYYYITIIFYQQALDKLSRYSRDRMHPIVLAGKLKKLIDKRRNN